MPPAAWLEDSKLWLVLDRAAASPHSLAEAAELALEGGVDVVVFRLKYAPQAEVRRLAIPVREICRRADAPFVISHYVELGLELGADAIHAGIADGNLQAIREQAGSQIALGYSAHSVDEAARMLASGADYAFLGPIFPTPAKLKYGEPLGLEVIAGALALPKPVVLIGGINQATLPQLIAMGGHRIAAIAALQSVPDITLAAKAMRSLLG